MFHVKEGERRFNRCFCLFVCLFLFFLLNSVSYCRVCNTAGCTNCKERRKRKRFCKSGGFSLVVWCCDPGQKPRQMGAAWFLNTLAQKDCIISNGRSALSCWPFPCSPDAVCKKIHPSRRDAGFNYKRKLSKILCSSSKVNSLTPPMW